MRTLAVPRAGLEKADWQSTGMRPPPLVRDIAPPVGTARSDEAKPARSATY